MDAEAMDELALKYVFRFVGASITRRLAESFVSIFTGWGSTHPISHRRVDYSTGNLRVRAYMQPLRPTNKESTYSYK